MSTYVRHDQEEGQDMPMQMGMAPAPLAPNQDELNAFCCCSCMDGDGVKWTWYTFLVSIFLGMLGAIIQLARGEAVSGVISLIVQFCWLGMIYHLKTEGTACFKRRTNPQQMNPQLGAQRMDPMLQGL